MISIVLISKAKTTNLYHAYIAGLFLRHKVDYFFSYIILSLTCDAIEIYKRIQISAILVKCKYKSALSARVRQEKQCERLSVSLSRQTMANWVIHIANEKLTPIYEQMRLVLLKETRLHEMKRPTSVK